MKVDFMLIRLTPNVSMASISCMEVTRMTKQDVTPDTLTSFDLRGVLDRAHEWPCHVRHAASAAKFSPDATRHDRQVVCDALNANGGRPTGDH